MNHELSWSHPYANYYRLSLMGKIGIVGTRHISTICHTGAGRWGEERKIACDNTLLHHHWDVCSLAPGKFEWNFRHHIFKQMLVIDDWGISCEIALIWMSLDFTDDQSTLVQVMAWCRQATSHYLSQCLHSSLSPCHMASPGLNELKETVTIGCVTLSVINGTTKPVPLVHQVTTSHS